MSEIENLVLEHLRAIRGGIAALVRKIDDSTSRVGLLEQHFGR
jgi:hypothetical protein